MKIEKYKNEKLWKIKNYENMKIENMKNRKIDPQTRDFMMGLSSPPPQTIPKQLYDIYIYIQK